MLFLDQELDEKPCKPTEFIDAVRHRNTKLESGTHRLIH